MKLRSIKGAAFSVVATILLSACGSDDDAAPSQGPELNSKYYVFVTDKEGYINIYSDDGADHIVPLDRLKPTNAGGGSLGVREAHFAHGKAFVPVEGGFVDADQPSVELGGGLVVVDLETLELEADLPLVSSLTAMTVPVDPNAEPVTVNVVSRIVHTYLDPDKKFLWLNNDGPRNTTGNDSVFRVNIDPMDEGYLSFVEIEVGDGHKKSALTFPSVEQPTAGTYFVTHDLSSRTLSVIDNDPVSATYGNLVDTIGLGAANTPHGMAYSPVSGHVYTGIVSGVDIGLSVLDVSQGVITHNPTAIPAGFDMTANQIPGGGYVHATHDHRWVMTAGYVTEQNAATPDNKRGYLSVIDAANNDTVVQVVDLGDVSSSSIDIAELEMHMPDGMIMNHAKVYVPSRTTSNNAINNVIVMVEFMLTDTGITKVNQLEIPVGVGAAHRNGEITPNNEHAYYPNGGDCGDGTAPGPDCKTVSVIDTRTNSVITTLTTQGHEPSSITIYELHPDAHGTTPHQH